MYIKYVIIKIKEFSVKKGFTLAEVLITLGIIGVIAALTLPALVQKYNEKVTINSLKKAYSVLDNAFMLAINDNGKISDWKKDGQSYHDSVVEVLSKYLKSVEKCSSLSDKCKTLAYYRLDGALWNDKTRADMILPDGVTVYIYEADDWIGVDVNGINKPNTWGRDFFMFRLPTAEKNRLTLAGAQGWSGGPESFEEGCKDKDNHFGYGCTAWVIVNENMDYLRCNDLSWENKTSCESEITKKIKSVVDGLIHSK